MKKLLILATLLIGTGAAFSYHQAKLLMDYCLSFVGYKVVKLSFKRIIIEMKFQIKNKSNIDITVTSFDFNVYMNGIYATKIKSSKQQIIKADSSSVISLLVDIEPQKNKRLADLDFLSQALTNIGGIRVGISGTLSLKAFGVSVKDQQVEIEMPLRDMLPDNKKPQPSCAGLLI